MRFLLDRCAGGRLTKWLRNRGHDVVESREIGADPGDRALLEIAVAEDRILVTIDTDFGELVYARGRPHAGLVRLPDIPTARRIAMMAVVLERFHRQLEARAVVTVRGELIRVSFPPRP